VNEREEELNVTVHFPVFLGEGKLENGRDQSTESERVVYMMKSRGPRTSALWNSTRGSICKEDRLLSHLTRKERKEDLNRQRTEPWIPNQDERRVIKMLWTMVSKAAEKSRRQRHDVN